MGPLLVRHLYCVILTTCPKNSLIESRLLWWGPSLFMDWYHFNLCNEKLPCPSTWVCTTTYCEQRSAPPTNCCTIPLIDVKLEMLSGPCWCHARSGVWGTWMVHSPGALILTFPLLYFQHECGSWLSVTLHRRCTKVYDPCRLNLSKTYSSLSSSESGVKKQVLSTQLRVASVDPILCINELLCSTSYMNLVQHAGAVQVRNTIYKSRLHAHSMVLFLCRTSPIRCWSSPCKVPDWSSLNAQQMN
jgi:hypothetical protein